MAFTVPASRLATARPAPVGLGTVSRVVTSWTVEHVAAVARSASTVSAAEVVADPSAWPVLGADDTLLWGRCRSSAGEPYEVVVDHVEAVFRCTCPSRRTPCKHAVALLLLWVRGSVPVGLRPAGLSRPTVRAHPAVGAAGSRPDDRPGPADLPTEGPAGDASGDAPGDAPGERMERIRDGLVELERWIEDRIRLGLAHPDTARPETWERLAARLVDARAGALANRVRRVAAMVGSHASWHADVLAELGVLHLLAEGGRRVGTLPPDLAASVAMATGWQVRRADVLAGVPETDDWLVAGRSDTREDRIVVRRWWLRGLRSGRWAVVLDFAVQHDGLDEPFGVGSVVDADLFRYPGASLRALVGRSAEPGVRPSEVPTRSVAEAVAEVGNLVAAEPWLERVGALVLAAPSRHDGRWVLTDDTGSVPLVGGDARVGALLAASLGSDVAVAVEWTPAGFEPLAVHLPDRSYELGTARP